MQHHLQSSEDSLKNCPGDDTGHPRAATVLSHSPTRPRDKHAQTLEGGLLAGTQH